MEEGDPGGAGLFQVWQYITLMRRIFLIDCPGVVYPSGDTETDIVLKGVVSAHRAEHAGSWVVQAPGGFLILMPILSLCHPPILQGRLGSVPLAGSVSVLVQPWGSWDVQKSELSANMRSLSVRMEKEGSHMESRSVWRGVGNAAPSLDSLELSDAGTSALFLGKVLPSPLKAKLKELPEEGAARGVEFGTRSQLFLSLGMRIYRDVSGH